MSAETYQIYINDLKLITTNYKIMIYMANFEYKLDENLLLY